MAEHVVDFLQPVEVDAKHGDAPLARFAVTRLLPRHAAWLAEAAHGAEGLDALAAERRVVGYIGFDCTAASTTRTWRRRSVTFSLDFCRVSISFKVSATFFLRF